MKRYFSPLRYPGGKGKLHRLFRHLLTINRLEGSTYIEPFAGGAGLAITLLADGYVNKIWINDLDISIYAFWHSLLYDTDNLCKLINDTDIKTENWNKYRRIQHNKENSDLLSLGFSTFYLNRINRSGIIMGGVIGGLNQLGPFKVDARFNKKELISRISNIASYANRLIVTNLDANELLLNHLNKVSRPFIYLDPPYYKKADKLYVNHFHHEDHQELCSTLGQLKHPWLVTYDNVHQIKDMYAQYSKYEFAISYSAGVRCKAKEVMFAAPGLKLPDNIDCYVK